MTVADKERRKQYTAASGQTNFVYDFIIFEATDLKVYQTPSGETPDPDADLLVLGVDYTVTNVGVAGGGEVVLIVGANLGDTITINGDMPIKQDIVFAEGNKFKAATINLALDRLTIVEQQLETLIKQRMLLYQPTDQLDSDGGDNTLPKLASNTGNGIPMWTKNANGKLVGALLDENTDASTLRSELADNSALSNGAGIIGYYNTNTSTPTNVKDVLDMLVNTVIADTFKTGDAKPTMRATADPGFVMMNDGSIGSASSGATTRANADTEDLFTLLWNNVLDTWAPVSGGRGASAAADFAANKTLMLPKQLGRALSISGTAALSQTFTADASTDICTVANLDLLAEFDGQWVKLTTTGTLPGGLATGTNYFVLRVSSTQFKLCTSTANVIAGTVVNITSAGSGTHTITAQFTNRDLGEYVGNQSHLLTVNELPSHKHTITSPDYWKTSGGGNNPSGGGTSNGEPFPDTDYTGNSSPHSIMQPSSFWNIMIKL